MQPLSHAHMRTGEGDNFGQLTADLEIHVDKFPAQCDNGTWPDKFWCTCIDIRILISHFADSDGRGYFPTDDTRFSEISPRKKQINPKGTGLQLLFERKQFLNYVLLFVLANQRPGV